MTAPRPGIRRGTKRAGKLGDVEGQRAREGSAGPRTAAVNPAGAGRASEGMTRKPRPAPEAGVQVSHATTGVSSPSPRPPSRHREDSSHPHPGLDVNRAALLRSERGARGGKGPPTRSRGPLVPGVPCGGLRDTARRAAASAVSRAPAPGPIGSDRPATVPRKVLRFHSRRQRRWEPAKTCFPAVMNFITLFLSTRKDVSFGGRFFFFFFPPRKGFLGCIPSGRRWGAGAECRAQ